MPPLRRALSSATASATATTVSDGSAEDRSPGDSADPGIGRQLPAVMAHAAQVGPAVAGGMGGGGYYAQQLAALRMEALARQAERQRVAEEQRLTAERVGDADSMTEGVQVTRHSGEGHAGGDSGDGSKDTSSSAFSSLASSPAESDPPLTAPDRPLHASPPPPPPPPPRSGILALFRAQPDASAGSDADGAPPPAPAQPPPLPKMLLGSAGLTAETLSKGPVDRELIHVSNRVGLSHGLDARGEAADRAPGRSRGYGPETDESSSDDTTSSSLEPPAREGGGVGGGAGGVAVPEQPEKEALRNLSAAGHEVHETGPLLSTRGPGMRRMSPARGGRGLSPPLVQSQQGEADHADDEAEKEVAGGSRVRGASIEIDGLQDDDDDDDDGDKSDRGVEDTAVSQAGHAADGGGGRAAVQSPGTAEEEAAGAAAAAAEAAETQTGAASADESGFLAALNRSCACATASAGVSPPPASWALPCPPCTTRAPHSCRTHASRHLHVLTLAWCIVCRTGTRPRCPRSKAR